MTREEFKQLVAVLLVCCIALFVVLGLVVMGGMT